MANMTIMYLGSVFLVFALASSMLEVSGQETWRRYSQACDSDFRCEPNKGYMCKDRRCQCGNGYYTAKKDQCVVKFGQSCFAGSHELHQGLAGIHLDCEDPFAYCNQRTSLCECRRGSDCSAAGSAATKNAICDSMNIFAIGLFSFASILYSRYSIGRA